MSQVYISYDFKVSPLQPATEILIAELGYAGFESFVETEEGVTAYIQKEEWSPNILEEINILDSDEFKIEFTFSEIEQINWNSEWEKNFDPIEVDGKCTVRAPFHPNKNFEYEIVIEPKMSFGTGHHETTFMMLQFILENNFEEKSVLDMGCGTAVLAILAEMRGASNLDAIDIDEWCFENSLENIQRNDCKNISVYLGDASLLDGKKYDVVIANINRNILLNDMEAYRKCLAKDGELYLSGFYKEDLPIITEACNNLGFTFVENKEKNKWVAAKFKI
ncbi:MAG: 50S ribosomal protein L11 methyltransferase [Aequorivita sp.]|jgi:ribosomal protein L11 methyltransferase|nr:50S ribosomal protein L11 methyltransferase [Aequorivita sp.]MBP41985.1 50S ribosomal protein L11 methyltransferase [Aequorivita sp.]HBC04701.1 50S ribosomal protein L11 methyltransferase [Aequorivita sp.]|tara:strand:- start:49059 stop:49892 length:834 start_codon:yes stop_codon:yes gene_type:complete